MQILRHPLVSRLIVITLLLLGLFLGCGVLFELWRIAEHYIQKDPEYMGVCLAFRVGIFAGLGLPVAIGLLYSVFRHWFMLSKYSVSESGIEMQSPILRHTKQIRFDEIAAVLSINCLSCKASGYGRKLLTSDGRSITLSIEFPLWPKILQQCSNAVVEQEVMGDLKIYLEPKDNKND